MCGICGIVNLSAPGHVERALVERMSLALAHRGPDQSGAYYQPGLGLASRRLSIVGLADGRQPIFNEDRSVAVVFNGEIFDYPEQRAELIGRGHRFATSSDTEVLVHLWEEHGEAMLSRVRGQFAFALLDTRRGLLILARDRVGIVPLHWAVRDEWLYFGSEIKALLAGGVRAEADPKGIDHVFTFFGIAGRRTAFRDIQSVAPGTYLRIQLPRAGRPGAMTEHVYWDLAFPQGSDEYDRRGEHALADEFGALFERAVKIRLRGDVPVAGYLSGGVDSTSVMSAATRALGRPLPAFTIRIPSKALDETDRALLAARSFGAAPTIVECDERTIRDVYPGLVTASETPVVDTSCAALYRQAQVVREQGYKVVLTGEGADEALAGYPWLKVGKALGLLDFGGVRASNLVRCLGAIVNGRLAQWPRVLRFQAQVGGTNGLLDLYCLFCVTRRLFYSPAMLEELGEFSAFDDLALDAGRIARFHPLNRALYLGYKTMLPGVLMSQKGDRPAMHSSVETRHPFLDEAVIDFCARLPPSLKLHGLRGDKYLLRRYASRLVPLAIAERPKSMFRAPYADTFLASPPSYVESLLSESSLRATGYFDPKRVSHFRTAYRTMRLNPMRRFLVEAGLTGVIATQLWHHTFVSGGLCDLPTWTAAAAPDHGRLAAPDSVPEIAQ
jgi:asparagine synthase (glutamine-hydrolysing)